MEVEIEVVGPEAVEVRWPKSFGNQFSAIYLALADCLEAVDGVDEVDVLRYSALLKIADHVSPPDLVTTAVGNALLDDPYLAGLLADHKIYDLHIKYVT